MLACLLACLLACFLACMCTCLSGCLAVGVGVCSFDCLHVRLIVGLCGCFWLLLVVLCVLVDVFVCASVSLFVCVLA